MTEEQERPSFIVEFKGGEVEFGPASYDAWINYLDKIGKGKEEAGAKELAFSCCISHGPDPKTGGHSLAPILDAQPAALSDIVDEICEISGEEGEIVEGDGFVKLENMTFRSPRGREWSSYQEAIQDSGTRNGEVSRDLLQKLCDKPEVFAAYVLQFPTCMGSLMVPLAKMAGRGIRIKRKK